MWRYFPRLRSGRSAEPSARAAMTLVELLIVVTVIVLLMAVSVPAIAPAIRENRIREASRQVNVLVSRAKARAGETGRRVALWLERSAPGSNAAMDLYLAESPREYNGDFQGALCLLYYEPSSGRWRLRFDVVGAFSGSLTANDATSLVRYGENFKIRFAGRGVWYDGYRDAGNGNYYLRPPQAVLKASGTPPDNFIPPVGFFDPGPDGHWGAANTDDDGNGLVDDIREAGIAVAGSDEYGNGTFAVGGVTYAVGATYQIQLIPRRVSSSRLQLPEGTIVDLGYSGMGISLPVNRTAAVGRAKFAGLDFDAANTTGVAATNNTPVMIVFDSSGEVESVIYDATTFEPAGPVHLLVGLYDQLIQAENTPTSVNPIAWSTVDSVTVTYDQNVSDLSTIWVSIGDRSGSVTTSENGWEIIGAPANFYQSFRRSREYAQQAQTMGGR